MAKKAIALGAAASELVRVAMRKREADRARADNEFARSMRIVRQDCDLAEEVDINLSTDDRGNIVLEYEVPDIPAKPDEDGARVEGGEA